MSWHSSVVQIYSCGKSYDNVRNKFRAQIKNLCFDCGSTKTFILCYVIIIFHCLVRVMGKAQSTFQDCLSLTLNIILNFHQVIEGLSSCVLFVSTLIQVFISRKIKKCLFIYMQGDLHAFLKRKGALKPLTTVKFALDIARWILLSTCHILY